MNSSHEKDFLLAQERDAAAMQRLLDWIDTDIRTMARQMSRRIQIPALELYGELRQEFVLMVMRSEVDWRPF